MFGINLTGVLSVAFLAYMGHSFWSLSKLYFPPECKSDCLTTSLSKVTNFLITHYINCKCKQKYMYFICRTLDFECFC